MLIKHLTHHIQFRSVQFSHSVVSDSATPWTTAHQASLSITNSWSLLKLVFIESVMPSNHLILCHPLLFPPLVFLSIMVFSNQLALHIRQPNYWTSASASVLLMTIQDYFLQDGLVGSPCSPRDSQESFPTPQLKSHQFFGVQPSLWSNSHIHT